MRATKLVNFSMLAAVFGLVSCSRHPAQPVAASSDPIRLSGVVEPAELLIAPQKKIEVTPEISALLSVLQDVKKGDELSRLPAVDAYIKRFPNVGDMYSIRAELRCMKGDLTDVKRLINFNSSDLDYMTDGHVKPDERGSSVCV